MVVVVVGGVGGVARLVRGNSFSFSFSLFKFRLACSLTICERQPACNVLWGDKL